MLFNSLDFLIFFPIVFALYTLISEKYKKVLLLFASYYFYMSFSPKYVLLIIYVTLIAYFTAFGINGTVKKKRKKFWLSTSIVLNLFMLFIFKYFNFFNEILVDISSFFSLSYIPFTLNILLPVGISFFTFQAISYSIDVYRGDKKIESDFISFSLFVSFFPQLVAGPIERSKDLLPQFFKPKPLNYYNLRDGFFLAMWGMFKKVVIADRVGIYVNEVYGNVNEYSGLTLIIATFFFAVQVYADFSGYSDIAIGIARMLGYKLSLNFNLPYLSKSVSEFWRKWHITLLTWFRDYLFNPIAIRKRYWGVYATAYATLITFLLSGLWHGAAWTFVIWGLLHAIALIYEVFTLKQRRKWKRKINKNIYGILSNFLVFCFVNLTYVFFRAETIKDAFYILINSFNFRLGFQNVNLFNFKSDMTISIILIFLLFIIEVLEKNYHIASKIMSSNSIIKIFLLLFGVFSIILLGKWEESAFIYFQF